MKILKKYILHWDFMLAAFSATVLVLIYSGDPSYKLREVLEIMISVNAILFGIYFAAFSIISSTASDDFVLFIEDKSNLFSVILDDFRFVFWFC